MPFDSVPQKARDRGYQLVWALRQELPQNFQWNFDVCKAKTDCGFAGCALGLADIIWPKLEIIEYNVYGSMFDAEKVAEIFGISEEAASYIFDEISNYYTDHITPQQVADALEAELNKQEE